MLSHLILFTLLILSIGDSYLYCVADLKAGDEEYAVYSALLNEKYVEQRAPFLIIVDQTVATPFIIKELEREDLGQMLSPVSPSTLDAFKEKNREPQTLKGALSLKVRYTLLGNNELSEFFKGDVIRGWEEFYKRNPGATGYIRLSKVGFNPEGDEALVYVEHGCGATCGTGNYAVLTKRVKGWKVERVVMLWVS